MGGGGLCSEDLYLLDFRDKDSPIWLTVPTDGSNPGQRYGHSMVYHRPHLIVCFGNDGEKALNDVWIMNAETPPFTWEKVGVLNPSRSPIARGYHAADICTFGPAAGMMVVFGGRNNENRSLKDTWG